MPTQVVNFRKDVLDGLPARSARFEVADTKVAALRLTVFPTGLKTFYLYRKVQNKPQRIKIGRFHYVTIENARKKATLLNSSIALGNDPLQEIRKARQELKFTDLFDLYYQQHLLLHTKRPAKAGEVLGFHIFPRIGSWRLSEVSKDTVLKIFSEIALQGGKAAANEALAYTSATYSFGIKHEYFSGSNPCSGIKKFKLPSRDRFLSTEELSKFFKALTAEPALFRDYFLLLLYTGARKTNVMSMRWADVRLDLRQWRIAETEAKNNEVNVISLSKEALEVLTARKENNDKSSKSAFVFPSDGACGHLVDPKKAFRRIKERMNVADIRIHDLRRTLGSYMAISGASLPIIGKALNHKSPISTMIYARLSADPVLDAMQIATDIMRSSDEPKDEFRKSVVSEVTDQFSRVFSSDIVPNCAQSGRD